MYAQIQFLALSTRVKMFGPTIISGIAGYLKDLDHEAEEESILLLHSQHLS